MDNNPQDQSITTATELERQRLAAEAEDTERRKAESDERRTVLDAQNADAEVRIKSRLEMNIKKRTAVLELCAKFAVWATTNDIPYNYSDRNDKGWLLGHREGGSEEREVITWSGYGIHETKTEITLFESYRLLVGSDLVIHEVSSSDVIRSRKPTSWRSLLPRTTLSDLTIPKASSSDVIRSRKPTSWRSLLPRSALTEATPESYAIETIVDSIAKFTVAYNVDWLDE